MGIVIALLLSSVCVFLHDNGCRSAISVLEYMSNSVRLHSRSALGASSSVSDNTEHNTTLIVLSDRLVLSC